MAVAAKQLLQQLESQPSFAELHVDASLNRKDLLEKVASAPRARRLRLWLDNGIFQTAVELAEVLQSCYEHLGALARQEKLPVFEDMSVLPNLSSAGHAAFRGQTFDNVVLGGTFDRLHEGHKVLLTVAATMANKGLAVGVSGTPLLRDKAGASLLQDWGERAAAVADFLALFRPELPVRLEELQDAFGPALWPEMGALVVSAETEAGGAAVNERRRENNVTQLDVVAVPLVVSAGGKVSSTTARELDSLAAAIEACWAVVPEPGRVRRWLPLLVALARQAVQAERHLEESLGRLGAARAAVRNGTDWARAAARCLELTTVPGLLEAVAADAGWDETAVKLIREELGVDARSRL